MNIGENQTLDATVRRLDGGAEEFKVLRGRATSRELLVHFIAVCVSLVSCNHVTILTRRLLQIHNHPSHNATLGLR